MDKELNKVVSLLSGVRKTKILDKIIYKGKMENHDVAVCLTGLGKVAAGVSTALMIKYLKPSLVISCGVAGGYNKDLKPLDVVVGTKTCYYDVDMTADTSEKHEYGAIQGLPLYFDASTEALNIAKRVKLPGFAIYQGILMSADTFAGDRDILTNIIKSRFDQEPMAVDMESAAVGQVCYVNKVPYVTVRSISDVIGAANQITSYCDFAEEAARNASLIVMEIVTEYQTKASI